MSGTVDTAAQQAAARLAAAQQAARIAAEAAARAAQEAAARQQDASTQQAPETPAPDPAAIQVTQEQFVGDAKLAEALNASKEQMKSLFEQAASLDGDADSLSNAELEQLFLNVQAGQPMQAVAPAAKPEAAETKEADAPEAEEAEKEEATSKTQSTLEKALGTENKTIERYLKAKKAFDAAKGDPKACAECATELLTASAAMMQELGTTGAKNPALRKQVATALDLVSLDIQGAQASVQETLTTKGAAGALLGDVAKGFGRLLEVTDAFKTLASGGEGDGLKHGPAAAEAAVEITKALGDLFGTEVRDAAGKVDLDASKGLLQKLYEGTGKTAEAAGLKDLRAKLAQTGLELAERAGGSEAYKTAAQAWERIAKQAGKFGEKTDAVMEQLKTKVMGALERWAKNNPADDKLMFEKLGQVLGKVASFLEKAGTVLTAVQVALEMTDFMLRELYMPAKEALTGIFSNQRHMEKDPQKLLELYQGGGGAFTQQAESLLKLKGQPGYDELYAQVTGDARAFVDQVNGSLLCQNPWDKGQTSEILRDEVGEALKGKGVTVVEKDGQTRPADAGELYARARGKQAPPLSDAEAAALAGPLGKAATTVLAKDLATRDNLAPTGLAPENVDAGVVTAMAESKDPLVLAQYVRSLSDEKLQKLPATAKRQIYEALAKQQAATDMQALGGDALPEAAGRVLAGIMQDNAKAQPPITPAQQAADLKALVPQAGSLNTDNVLRYAAKAMDREALDKLPTEVKQAIAAEVSKAPVTEADVETATKVAESIRRVENGKEKGKGDALADAIEKPFSWNADAVARTRVAEMKDEELDKLPLAQKQALAKAMMPSTGTVGELTGAFTADDVKQVTRLAEAIRRNKNPEDGLTKEAAAQEADKLIDAMSHFSQDDAALQRVTALEPAELAKLPEADLNQLLDQLTASATRVEDKEKDAIAKVTLALVEKAGLDANGQPKPEPQRANDMKAAYDGARAKLEKADPLFNVDSGSLKDDVASRMVDQLEARGKAAEPAQDMLKALPEAIRTQLFEDLSQGWASADDLDRATKIANTFEGDAKTAMLGKLTGTFTNQSDVTTASLKNTTDAQLAEQLKADPAKGYQLIEQLQANTLYTSDEKDALTARVALAMMKGKPPAEQAQIYTETFNRTGYGSSDNVTRAIIGGMDPYALAALPQATRDAMRNDLQGSAWVLTGSTEDADNLKRLGHADELAKSRPNGPRDQASAERLMKDLDGASEDGLAKMAAQRPGEFEAYIQDVRNAPDSPQKQAVLEKLASALRENDRRTDETKAAVDARLKAIGL